MEIQQQQQQKSRSTNDDLVEWMKMLGHYNRELCKCDLGVSMDLSDSPPSLRIMRTSGLAATYIANCAFVSICLSLFSLSLSLSILMTSLEIRSNIFQIYVFKSQVAHSGVFTYLCALYAVMSS